MLVINTWNNQIVGFTNNQPFMFWLSIIIICTFYIRCTLLDLLRHYKVELPLKLMLTLEHHIELPGEDKHFNDVIHYPALGIELTTDVYLTLKMASSITLSEIFDFLSELEKYLKPLKNCMKELVYFKLCKNQLFQSHFEHMLQASFTEYIPSNSLSPEKLEEVFSKAKSVLKKIVQADASYSEISANGSLNFQSLDVEKEFRLLLDGMDFGSHFTVDLEGVKNLMKLIQYSPCLKAIQNACQVFNLKTCQTEKKYHQIAKEADKLILKDHQSRLTIPEATVKWHYILSILGMDESNYFCLKLFSMASKLEGFLDFIKNLKLFGEAGQVRFQQLFELVTGQIQPDEFEQEIINSLYGSFKLVSPLLYQEQSFVELLASVKRLSTVDMHNAFLQLEVVKANINTIQTWFLMASEVSFLCVHDCCVVHVRMCVCMCAV